MASVPPPSLLPNCKSDTATKKLALGFVTLGLALRLYVWIHLAMRV